MATLTKQLSALALKSDCPTCGAKAGDPCVKIRTSTPTDPHRHRLDKSAVDQAYTDAAATVAARVEQEKDDEPLDPGTYGNGAAAVSPPVRRAKREKKSKIERRRKGGLRIFGDGFVEHARNPQVIGKHAKSMLIRVDADFAQYLRSHAMKSGVSITEVSRILYLDLTHTEENPNA